MLLALVLFKPRGKGREEGRGEERMTGTTVWISRHFKFFSHSLFEEDLSF